MLCPNCGAENDEDGRFCVQCGKYLLKDRPTPREDFRDIGMRLLIVLAVVVLIVIMFHIVSRNGEREGNTAVGRTGIQKGVSRQPAYDADIDKKFFYIINLAKAQDYVKIVDRYGARYLSFKREIQSKYSFDQNEVKKRMDELNANAINNLKGTGFGGGDFLTIGDIAKIIFREGHKVTVLEKKQDPTDVNSNSPGERRMVIKVSYSTENAPVYLQGGNYIVREGIYDSRDAILACFEDYVSKPHSWAANEPMNTRNDLMNNALPNRVHDISEIVLIISDYWPLSGNEGYTEMPSMKTYSIKCRDGYETQKSVASSRE